MKKILIILLLATNISFGQSQEVKQLLLDVEKLAQLKQMLQQMKQGYQILHTGYTSIKNISQGNFSLHKDFLDGLLQVSPAVRKYQKVAEIISLQMKVVKESKEALAEFKDNKQFKAAEIEYMAKVYANLIQQSLASYSGNCPCPYNLDSLGRKCGKRSAHSKSGGESPLCFLDDITDEEVRRFRERCTESR